MKVLVCSRCNRVNPPGALYCHFDGLALGGDEAPLEAGSRVFFSPFVFPSGRTCRSFDELILAAEDSWDEAKNLLNDGVLGGFLGAMGRADLAKLAGQARSAPDPDRALDDLLKRLPSSARPAPKLHVQPSEINLGRVARSEKRQVLLLLSNEGMGLLHGCIFSDRTPWLMVGEPPGVPDKLFACRRDVTIPLQVIGERMRAGGKPLEGRVVIESSGGSCTLIVKAEVGVQAFPDGVLAGATSPRQLAEKAKGAPKEAVPLFERGLVKQWYEANGWEYPIQGPPAPGLGAIQQYFEALGLTAPPRVAISDLTVKLQGPPGAALEYTLKVTTEENRPVFAHATSSAPWLEVGPVKCNGKTARVKLRVPAVPSQPGESLLGRVQVHANGGQRFVVAVSLRITGDQPVPSGIPPLEPGLLTLDPSDVVPLGPELVETIDHVPPPAKRNPSVLVLDDDEPPAETSFLEPITRARPPRRRPGRALLRYLPGPLLLLVLLAGALLHDALLPDRGNGGPPPPPPPRLADPNPYLKLGIHDGPKQNRPDVMPRATMRFGLMLAREVDPTDAARLKRLTFDEWGRTNNTCIRIDGADVLFGELPGSWTDRYRPHGKDETGREIDGFDSIWQVGTIEVTQRVAIVPGSQSRCLDTCQVQYTILNRHPNRNAAPQSVGLRVLLDTFVGSGDGMPWLVPGRATLCDTRFTANEPAAIPDFVECHERNDLNRPGTVARLQLRIGKRVEPPTRFLLGAWPSEELQRFGHPKARGHLTLWEVPALPIRELQERVQALAREGKVKPEVAASVKPNSAATLYWDERPLAPGAKREVGFAYGLARTVADTVGKVMLTTSGHFEPGGEATVCGLVFEPGPGETVSIQLPEGFAFLSGRAEQPVPAGAIGVVTWRVRVGSAGKYEIRLRSSSGAAVMQSVTVSE